MTVRPSGPTVISVVVRSRMSMRSDIATAEDEGSRRGTEELKVEGKTSAGERQKKEQAAQWNVWKVR